MRFPQYIDLQIDREEGDEGEWELCKANNEWCWCFYTTTTTFVIMTKETSQKMMPCTR